MNYKPLKIFFKKNGLFYQQEKRTEKVCLYSTCTAFEVMHILKHDGRTIAGVELPPAEYLPSNEQFGSKGWSYNTREAAEKRYESQVAMFDLIEQGKHRTKVVMNAIVKELQG